MVTLPLMSFFYENACQSQLHFVKKKIKLKYHFYFVKKLLEFMLMHVEKTAHESIKMS